MKASIAGILIVFLAALHCVAAQQPNVLIIVSDDK